METSCPSIPCFKRPAGFTLVELIVTVAIVSILLAVAAPAMTSFLADQAAAANADEFAAAVRYSRTEAIKRGQTIGMCASTDPTADAPGCDADDWSTGWAITTPNGSVLRVQNALRAMDSATGAVTELAFLPNGIVQPGAGNYVFVPVGGDTAKQRTVKVATTGKVTVCYEKSGEEKCS
jgi:type IV fimbrial biogenesis protein FimT